MEITIPDWIGKGIAYVVGSGIILILANYLLGLTWSIDIGLGI